MQIHELSSELEDQAIAPTSYSDLDLQHFHFGRTKTPNLKPVSLCSFGAIIL